MLDHLHIAPADPGDAEAIWQLQQLAYQQEARLYNDWTIAPLCETLDELRGRFANLVFLKAVDGGRIVGSVRAELHDGVCYIGRLIVHPDHQRHGIGSALMQAIEARFADAVRFELFTGHLSEGTLRLYRRLGYAAIRMETVTPALTLVFMMKLSSPVR